MQWACGKLPSFGVRVPDRRMRLCPHSDAVQRRHRSDRNRGRGEGIMVRLRIGGLSIVVALGALLGGLPVRADACEPLIERFNRAIDSGDETAAQTVADQIATDAQCGRLQVSSQRRLAAFRLQSVHHLMARGRPVVDFERLLVAADRPAVLWQASATLGEVRFGARRFGKQPWRSIAPSRSSRTKR